MSNEDMTSSINEDIIRITKLLGKSDVLIDEISETVKHEKETGRRIS